MNASAYALSSSLSIAIFAAQKPEGRGERFKPSSHKDRNAEATETREGYTHDDKDGQSKKFTPHESINERREKVGIKFRANI